MTAELPKSPRVVLPVSELLIVVAIISALIAFLLPAVNAAREAQRQPPLWIEPFYEDHPWLVVVGAPIVITGCFAALLGLLRYLLPEVIRKRFPWRAPPKAPTPPPEPIADSRPAIVASAMAFVGAGILFFVATHVRADRTNRRPVVTWEGLLAEYIRPANGLGLALSAAGIFLGMLALIRFRSKWNSLAGVGVVLGGLSLFGSLFFYAAIYED